LSSAHQVAVGTAGVDVLELDLFDLAALEAGDFLFA
jgi:hypothetical protein